MQNYSDPRITRIIKLELKITEAVINGHKSGVEDKFKTYREELERLRKELDIKRKPSYEQSNRSAV
jgi:hypothetical protein